MALPLLVPDGTRLKLQPAALEYLAALRGPVRAADWMYVASNSLADEPKLADASIEGGWRPRDTSLNPGIGLAGHAER